MNKYIPDYLEDLSKAAASCAEGFKEVCKKLDLILDAIYDEEETDVTETAVSANNNEEPTNDNYVPHDKQTSAPKKRGRKPKE